MGDRHVDMRPRSPPSPRSPGLSRERSPSRSPDIKRGRSERGRSRSPRQNSESRHMHDSNPGINLFVSGLAHKTRDSDLDEIFSKYGKITKCNIMYDPHTKDSRGFAFICYEKVEEADAAREALQSYELHGRILTVERAKRTRARTPTPGHYYGPPKRRSAEPRYVDRFDPAFDRYEYRRDPPRYERGPPPRDYSRGGAPYGGYPDRGYYDRPHDRMYPDRGIGAPYDRERERDRDRDRERRRYESREPYGRGRSPY